ncbi:MAG: malate dehydrogenase [Syntrophales bacterium]|nr:malate dehydrogenase [Syntrophales bacterium]MCK9527826.1 malate dehydrogenase [Syntrophales bacterium]MDX9922077.1 malate dehydrogenase [Syntrophales bacterium]
MKQKVAVIGAGFVGTMVSQRIIEKNLAHVVLVDIVEGIPQGKALDMSQAASVAGFEGQVIGTNDFSEISGASIVVVTAGLPRMPGMTREDLAKKNAAITRSVMDNVRHHAAGAVVIVVTNPLDVMAHLAWTVSGFPPQRVFGMGGTLDEARFSYFLSRKLGVSPRDIEALVLGSHGEAMVPVERYTTVKGLPVRMFLSPGEYADIVARVRRGGAEIVDLLESGSAWHAPSASTVLMVEAILKDSKRMVSASALLEGQYGIEHIHIGVPVLLGAAGIERILEIPLDEPDLQALREAARITRNMVDRLIRGPHD